MQRRTLCTGLMLVGAIALNVLDAEQRQQAPKSTFWWLSGAEQTKDRLLVEAWWIWKSKDVWGDPEVGGTFIFSKEFVLEDAVREAEIRISAQNSYELTINGRKAGADDQVLTLEQYDISGFLKKGTNRLTVRAESKSWRAGLFVCASARLKNGQTSEVVSDGTWRFTREGETNSSFAAEVARGVDGGIWNNVGRLMVMPGAWHKLNSSVSCPGINWARPFAGRKLKIVAFQSRAKQRDTVELLHRTEMKVKAVFPEVSPRNYEYSSAPFFPATKGLFLEDALKELRGALDSAPDVILWGGFGRYFHTREEFFYEHVAELLRAFVSNGGGLIYVRGAIPPRTTPTGRKDKRGREILDRDYSFEKELTAKSVDGTNPFLSMGTPFGRLPGFYGSEGYDKVAELFQCGKGRVVRLLGVGSHYGQFADRAKDYSDLHYQYYLSFTIKTILWSGNEIPVISFSRFPNSVSVTRDAPEPSFRFTLDNVPVGCKAVVSVRSPLKHFNLPEQPVVSQGVERGAGILKPVYERTVNVPKGDVARVAVALPALPEGDYFVDVIIKQDGKTANWAVAALSIEDDLRISDVRLSKEYVDVADGKSDEIEAEAVLSTAAPNGSQVRFFLLDNYDRVISRREVTLGVGVRGRTKFPIPHFSTTLGRVRAELVVNGRFADVQTARFTAVRRDWDRFTLFGWTGRISGHQGNVYLRVLAGLGLDATEYASIDMDWLEAADRVALPAYPFPRLSRAIGDLDRLRDAYREKAAKTVENQMRYDPIAFTHGNEFFYGGGDEEGARVRDYQDFLKGRYKTIGRLNQQWGADYRFFEDVYPLSRRKPDELAKLRGNFVSQGDYLERADETRNYSRFVDQWLNNYRIYFELGKISVDSIKSHYPAARLGFDCPMWPHAYSGHDWHKVMNEFNFFAPYGRGGEIIPLKEARSYLKPGQFIGMTYGGYLYMAFNRKEELTDTAWHRWRLWNGLMQGFSSIWWYQLTPPGNECNLGPGFEPFPTLKVAADEIARIRKGYYTLFNRIRRDYGSVAVHDSILSRITSASLPQEFASKNNYGHCKNVHVAMHLLETLCGYDYTFVSDAQILKGELAKYRMLVMPTSFAVGDKVGAKLREFTTGGGTLLADVRPGIFDTSGKWDESQSVSAIFGLSYQKSLGRKLVRGEIRGSLLGTNVRITPEQPFPVDPATELKGATALCHIDGVPVVTVNEIGKGKAICLNIPFTFYSGRTFFDCQYAYWGHPDHNALMVPLLRNLMRASGIERPIKIETDNISEWPFGLEIARLPEGQAEYLGLTKKRQSDGEPSRRITVYSSQKGHVYDMLHGDYLGEREFWDIAIQQADVRLFAVLPYRLEQLAVALAPETVRQGDAIRGSVRVRPSTGRPVRHVVNVQVFRPDGKAVRYLSRNLETDKPKFSYFPLNKLRGYGRKGEVNFELPIALNEPEGKWRLVFTDVATQTSAIVEAAVVTGTGTSD